MNKTRSTLWACLIFGSQLIRSPALAAPGATGMPFVRGIQTDVVFVLGEPQTVQVPLTVFFAPIATLCHDETWAESTLSSVTIEAPCYGGWSCGPYLRPVLDTYDHSTGGGFDKPLTLQLHYDGSGSTATHGQIKILADIGCSEFVIEYRLVGSVNIQIVSPSMQWEEASFQTMSSATGNNCSQFQMNSLMVATMLSCK